MFEVFYHRALEWSLVMNVQLLYISYEYDLMHEICLRNRLDGLSMTNSLHDPLDAATLIFNSRCDYSI